MLHALIEYRVEVVWSELVENLVQALCFSLIGNQVEADLSGLAEN